MGGGLSLGSSHLRGWLTGTPAQKMQPHPPLRANNLKEIDVAEAHVQLVASPVTNVRLIQLAMGSGDCRASHGAQDQEEGGALAVTEEGNLRRRGYQMGQCGQGHGTAPCRRFSKALGSLCQVSAMKKGLARGQKTWPDRISNLAQN